MNNKDANREELNLDLSKIKEEFISKKFRWLCVFFILVSLAVFILSMVSDTFRENMFPGSILNDPFFYIIVGGGVVWVVLFVVSLRLSRRQDPGSSPS